MRTRLCHLSQPLPSRKISLELTSHYDSGFSASSVFSLALSLRVCPVLFCLGQPSALAPRAQSVNAVDLMSLSSPANNASPVSSPGIVLPAKPADLSLDLISASNSAVDGKATQLTALHINCNSRRPSPNANSCGQAYSVLLTWLRSLPRLKIAIREQGGHQKQ